MKNENKKLSRKRKRRIERKMKMDDKMKLILNEIRAERKKKNKKIDKIKQIEIQLVKIKYVNNPNLIESKLKELNKVQVVDKKLREIKNELLGDYGGEFGMIGILSVGDEIRETHIRFKNITDYERYIKAIDEGYEAEYATFNS